MKYFYLKPKQILFKASLRYLLSHPLQIFLAIIGVAMGVAVVIAIDLASTSAEHAFTATSETFISKVTHKIENSTQSIDEKYYARLRLNYPQLVIAPVLENNIKLENYPEQYFKLYGIDPLSESKFRDFNTIPDESMQTTQSFVQFFQPNAVFISEAMAKKSGLEKGDKLPLVISGAQKELFIAGLINNNTKNLEVALDNVFICDISVAQHILDRYGYISRIELSINNVQEKSLLNQLVKELPTDYHLIHVTNTSNALSQMTRAFRTNLQAMSLLALLVGMFLIYNTMTFSIIQRREQFATLRAIGVTHNEILGVVFSEAFLIGLAGTLLGIVLGTILGKGLLNLVVRTINDLYFDLNLSQLYISQFSLFKGLALGLIATLASAWFPMREAFKTPPRGNMNRSNLELKKQSLAPKLALTGISLLLSGSVFLMLYQDSLLVSFFLLFLIFCGYAILVPYMVVKIIYYIRPAIARLFGNVAAMSLSNISNSLSRTGIAMTALTLAVATTVGVTTMVGSFRYAVADWLSQSLIEDVYISTNTQSGNQSDKQLYSLQQLLTEKQNEIENVSVRLWTKVESDTGKKIALIQELPESGFKKFKFLTDHSLANYSDFQNKNTILVSEPLANKQKLQIGDSLLLFTDRGERNFKITGIYRDYTSDQGVISMSRNIYSRYWLNPGISSFGLYLKKNVSTDHFITQLQKDIAITYPDIAPILNIRSNKNIRTHSLEIFDQTFAITNVLRILTIIVAFVGILSAFMALQLERGREFATLRVIGLTPQQLWRWLIFETSFMGLIAGLLAIPMGLMLSVVLIFVINVQSFGWSMEISLTISDLLLAVLLSVSAALLAGIYPAYKMSRTHPAQSLRND